MRVSAHNPSAPNTGHRPVEELAQALGLSFQDRGLLLQALTHLSYVHEHSGDARESYERLEFLGDVVVRLVVSDELYHRLPDCDEGGLTRRWTTLLSQRALATVAERLNLADYVRLGRGSESTGGRSSPSVLGDVMESVIAAVYLDGGYDEARRFRAASAGRRNRRYVPSRLATSQPQSRVAGIVAGRRPVNANVSRRGDGGAGPSTCVHGGSGGRRRRPRCWSGSQQGCR